MTIRPRRRGYALMLVILEVTLLTAFWGVASRQLASTLLLVSYFKSKTDSQLDNNDAYKPMARALSLLETGDPPTGGSPGDTFTCNATIYTASQPGQLYFTIMYTKGADGTGGDGSPNETWTVTSTQQPTPSDPTTVLNWDNMPSSFGY